MRAGERHEELFLELAMISSSEEEGGKGREDTLNFLEVNFTEIETKGETNMGIYANHGNPRSVYFRLIKFIKFMKFRFKI